MDKECQLDNNVKTKYEFPGKTEWKLYFLCESLVSESWL